MSYDDGAMRIGRAGTELLGESKMSGTSRDTKFAHVSVPSIPFIDHPSHARPGIHAFPDRLYVVTVLDNPLRWRSRYWNYWQFQKHVEDAGGILITVELAMGDRLFEITDARNPYHVQVRTRDEMFRKENLQNLGLERVPLGAKYVACLDADVSFVRSDWCQESLHLLQHYDVIQMFSSYSDVGSNNQILRTVPSFMYNMIHEPEGEYVDEHSGYGKQWPRGKWSGAPGLAWAYRIEALDALGRLLDKCILGGGDSHMAFGLAQRWDIAKLHAEIKHGCSDAYLRYIAAWQLNAARLKTNIGMMDGSLLHHWHGPKANRGYATRWQILESNHFDPFVDVMYSHEGVLTWTGDKSKLRDEIRHYFRARREDDTE
jgi:hypothetical protein